MSDRYLSFSAGSRCCYAYYNNNTSSIKFYLESDKQELFCQICLKICFVFQLQWLADVCALHHLLFKTKITWSTTTTTNIFLWETKQTLMDFYSEKKNASFVFDKHEFIEIFKSIIKAYLDKSIFLRRKHIRQKIPNVRTFWNSVRISLWSVNARNFVLKKEIAWKTRKKRLFSVEERNTTQGRGLVYHWSNSTFQ